MVHHRSLGFIIINIYTFSIISITTVQTIQAWWSNLRLGKHIDKPAVVRDCGGACVKLSTAPDRAVPPTLS
jgi:hypothetical protein